MTRFAFFDFDGTLLKGDSIVAFILYARQQGACGICDGMLALMDGLLWKAKLINDKTMKSGLVRFLWRMPKEKREELSRNFCIDVLSPALYKDGLSEIALRKKEGCKIVLVSASHECYLKYMQPYVHYDVLLATKLDESTGIMIGNNCKGSEKVKRINDMLLQDGLRYDRDHSHGYGNSFSDKDMLEFCGNIHCVNATSGLRKAFQNRPNVVFDHWR